MLNPWRLRLIDGLDRLGTVRAVATALHLSPASVSEQLARLEREAGTSLFERRGRLLELTPAGRRLAQLSREVLQHLEAVEVELSEMGTEAMGVVRVGGFASAVSTIVLPAMAALARSHPRLELQVHELEPHDSVEALHRGTCDVVVTFDQEDVPLVEDPVLRRTELTRDPLLVVAAAGRRLGDGSAPVRLEELAGERWALESESSQLGRLLPGRCRAAGFEPHVVARCTSLELLLDLCARDLAVTVLPQRAVSQRGDIATYPVEGLGERRIWALVRRGTLARRAVQVVREALVAAAQ
ncbi:LysR family transcriptional regulator [Xylanimonas oleitrophica]|uniref:LysR family transcriptional regulator n=1 Tax=Xylanimonas oleitrophica TaxID=2607479 RepID=A0A2W5XTQ5_9MICO|nr:LysR substrate-binding domain-containing protein [Xylanimonas oleitrophica]PZR53498.1 LysR family transcriptional regulator [Xylanimonas oleitrophica]